MRISLKDKWRDGSPGSEFEHGTRRGDPFSFTSQKGKRYDGIMLSANKGVLNIPGGIRFDARFENPASLRGERREVTKEFMWVTIN